MSKILGISYVGKYAYLRDGRVALIENIKIFATGGENYKTYSATVTMKIGDKTVNEYYSRRGICKTNSNLDIIQIWNKDTYKLIARA